MDLAFFADMAWKSALIAGAALLFASALRSRSAADRTLVLRIGVVMLLALPLLALALPALEIVAFSAPEPSAAAQLDPALLAALAAAAPTTAAAAPATIWDDPTPLVLLAWLGGVVWVGARLLAGLVTLRRWTRAARPVTCPAWLAAFERVRWQAADGEKVRLLVSDEVRSPLSWGWRHPAILIDTDTLREPADAEAILAHEIAHAARRDWPALIASRLATALFWFNPLVWLLEREAVQQAEEAADIAAAERVEPALYAQTLLAWARAPVAVPATSIAPSARALGRRVRAILDGRRRERPSGSAWTAMAILACIGVAAPVAAMQLVAAAPPAPAAPAAPAAVAPPVPAAPGVPASPSAAIAPEPEAMIIAVPDVSGIVDQTLAAVLPQIPAILAAATAVHPEDAAEAAEAAEEAEEALEDAREEMRRSGHVSRAQIEAAMHAAREAQRHAHRLTREDMERIRRDAVAAARAAPRAVAIAMTHSADGMMRGAEGMEQGARGMAAEADRLQNRDYRERMIAEARARGETMTHERLLEAAERMREGSIRMREGAREMRQAAVRMRAGRHD